MFSSMRLQTSRRASLRSPGTLMPALSWSPHTFPFANRKRVVEAMAQYRVPAVYGIAEMVRAGGLVSYGQDLGAQWRMAASYVDKILKGAKATDLPARYANKHALAINTRAASAMGLEAPARLLARADEVVD
jgi:putative tryptophan/tyrosine transport system substrate-binding protein